MRTGIAEVAASAMCVAFVVGALVWTDARVRGRAEALLQDPFAASRSVGDRFAELARVVWVAACEETVEHAPLVALAAVGAILVVLLSRA